MDLSIQEVVSATFSAVVYFMFWLEALTIILVLPFITASSSTVKVIFSLLGEVSLLSLIFSLVQISY